MFTSFEDDESIGCQSFRDIQVNEVTNLNKAGSSGKSTSRIAPSMGHNILSALKGLQDRLLQLANEKNQLAEDNNNLNKNFKAYNNAAQVQPVFSRPFASSPNSKETRPFSVERYRNFTSSIDSPASSRQQARCCDDDDKLGSGRPHTSNKSAQNSPLGPCPRFEDFDMSSCTIQDDSFFPLKNAELAKSAESQLQCASARCTMLEKQLENMREKVCNAEKDRALALEKQIKMAKERGKQQRNERQESVKRVRMENFECQIKDLLEAKEECQKKMESLEEELQHERHQRKLLLDRNIHLESKATSQQLLHPNNIKSSVRPSPKQNKNLNDKRYEKPTRLNPLLKCNRPKSPSHYHLNLADLPFINGKSTSPSPGFSATVQSLLYKLKMHNPQLCGKYTSSPTRKKAGKKKDENQELENWEEAFFSEDLESGIEEMEAVIETMQEDFSKLVDEHCVLKKRMETARDEQLKCILEEKLDKISLSMEQKGSLITSIRKHQYLLQDIINKKSQHMESKKETKKPTGANKSKKQVFRKPGVVAKQRQEIMRDIRTINQGLNRHDVSWEAE